MQRKPQQKGRKKSPPNPKEWDLQKKQNRENAEEAEKQRKTEQKEILPLIEYEDFAKLDIRVGKVLLAEPIKKSKKLLQG